ncbi:MAG: UDP-N-acetylglucosamine 2-epimerase (non-hydrolyzing), partial [Gemmatimonadetes bacterium]|nr:UDP-N-acetylglucosamine 2-epimerase (non-hydrolyzing) [Gemmatimonadota bacterium]
DAILVHTGQHYDERMSGLFFDELGIPAPNLNLEVGSGSHAVQTARIMERVEPVLERHRPDWMLVYGDVNSTMAAAIVAAKLGIRTAHVEAGLRSDDRTMPEEINRLVTDRLADLLLTPSRDADARLRAEGEPESEIVFVGNVMIDTLYFTLGRLGLAARPDGRWADDGSVVVTLHRPSNVDEPARLASVMAALRTIAETRSVHFPAHPRTRARMAEFGIATGRVHVTDPVPYEAMLGLVTKAHCVITDSGGLQEETTALGIPCLTVRPNTERPVTITEGTNRLVPDAADLVAALAGVTRAGNRRRPEGWDGHAGERIIAALKERTA